LDQASRLEQVARLYAMSIALVSIIICTRNRADSLAQTLRALVDCKIPLDIKAELLVVDNGSTDRTEQIVNAADIPKIRARYILEPRTGQSHARNRGIAESGGEAILFTDDDVRLQPDWIERMARPLLNGEADAVQGGIKIAPHLRKSWMTRVEYGVLFEITSPTNEQRRNPFMVGANMGFARRVLKRVPYFDSELGPGALGYGDDALFCEQLKQAGYRVQFVDGATVEHHFDELRWSRESFLASAEKHGRTAAYMMYHWSHERVRLPRLRLFKNALWLAYLRFFRSRECRRIEGVYEPEFFALYRFWLYRSYLAERKKPRKYAFRGLVKLGISQVSAVSVAGI
jgi:glucosyl-dolichyl phosphate glucuronosyltransferase